MKNIIDSCGWIEVFLESDNKDFFLSIILDKENILVSPLNIYEVSRILLAKVSEKKALEAMLFMKQFAYQEVTPAIALQAAKISMTDGLAMADSILLSTAKNSHATFWTQDIDFKGMEGVQYIEKK